MDAGRPERRTYGSYHQFLYRYIEYRRLAVYFPAMYDRRRFVPDDPQPWDPVHALWLRDEEQFNALADEYDADQGVILVSSFDTGESGVDASLNKNSTYDGWQWMLVRSDGGKWRHVDHGY